MKKTRDYIFYLEDIEDAMTHVLKFTAGLNPKSFKINRLVVDAVIRNFEVMGEASKNIPGKVKERYPEMPWNKIYQLRNIISHDYFGIDYEVIWNIITKNLPENHKQIIQIIQKEKSNN